MIAIQKWRTKTSVYYHLRQKDKDFEIIVAQGGTASSKTVSICQRVGDLAVDHPGCTITITGQDFPNLRRGALRDWQRLISENPAFAFMIKNPSSEHGPYKFKNGSVVEFVTYQTAQDAKSGKRQYLFINEANGVPYEIFFELEQRTSVRTYIDYNPTAKFWAHTEVVPLKRCYAFISSYTHNEFCPEKIKAQIKSYFVKWQQTGSLYWENKWKVYGLGQTGIVEGVVIKDWKVVEMFPDRSELSNFYYGLDWGFSNDPMALIKCGNRKGNKRIVSQQLLYETGINAYTLDELFPKLGLTKFDPVIADSANMDAIVWLQKKGWNLIPAEKGPGSVKSGIELINQCGLDIVQGSNDIVYECGNYLYKSKIGVFDKNEPIDKDNHAIDAIRYGNRYAILGTGIQHRKTRSGTRTIKRINI